MNSAPGFGNMGSAPKSKIEEEEKGEVLTYSVLMEKLSQIKSITPLSERLKLESLITQHLNGYLDGRDEKTMGLGELSDAVRIADQAARSVNLNGRIVKAYRNALSQKLDDAVSAGRARIETKEEVLDNAKISELEKDGHQVIQRPYTGELIILNPNTPEAEELKKRTIE